MNNLINNFYLILKKELLLKNSNKIDLLYYFFNLAKEYFLQIFCYHL